MFDFSFAKLVLLAVIALVVLGPEKLPKTARMAGVMLRRLRVGWESVRSEVERELEIEEIKRAAHEAAMHAEAAENAVRNAARTAHSSVNETAADVVKAAKTAGRDVVTTEEPRDGDA